MSDANRFINFLKTNADLDERFVHEFVTACRIISVDKGDYLLRQGEISSNTYFVEEGLLRQFSIDEKGKEHILMFAPEEWFVSDRESVYYGQQSEYFIQALENSKVLLMDEQFILNLALQSPSFMGFNNRLLHNHIRHLQKRINMLLSATAEERYINFVNTYPNILLRVPQAMIASYLGITPESLSRVRKDLAQRHSSR